MFTGLDHLAIVVPDTEDALKIWRDENEPPAAHQPSGTPRMPGFGTGSGTP